MTVTMMLNPARIIEIPIRPNATSVGVHALGRLDADSGAYPVHPVGKPPSSTLDSRMMYAAGVSQNDSASIRGNAIRFEPIISGTR